MLTTHSDLAMWLGHYGPFALYLLLAAGIIGLPIPDEGLIVLAGVLAAEGHLNIFSTWLACVFGAMTGVTISYLLGYTFGHYILVKFANWFHLKGGQLERIHEWYHHLGKWVLFIGYYIPLVRHLTGLVAGISKLEFRYIVLYGYTGAIVWSSLFLWSSYYFGKDWKQLFDFIISSRWLIALAVIFLVGILYLGRYLLRHISLK